MAEAAHERVAAAAQPLVAEVERSENTRFELARVAISDGVGLAMYRSTGEGALIVLLDEEAPGRWEALGAATAGLGGSRNLSMRPSARGDWIVAIAGTAPPDARRAVFDFAGAEQRADVVNGFYAFAVRTAAEPDPELPRTHFE